MSSVMASVSLNALLAGMHEVFGEAALAVHAHAHGVAAQMAAAGAAIAAIAAGEVAFAGDAIADARSRALRCPCRRCGRSIRGRPPWAPEWSSAPTRPSGRCACRCRRSRSCAILMSTSLGPTFGLRDVLHPDAGLGFALDQCFHLMSSMVAADLDEGGERAFELRIAESRGHLRADARFALRHHGEREADDVHAFAQQLVGEARGQRRVADHDRDDGMLAGQQLEAGGLHAGAEFPARAPNRVSRSCGMFSTRSSARSVTAATTGGMLLENR